MGYSTILIYGTIRYLKVLKLLSFLPIENLHENFIV